MRPGNSTWPGCPCRGWVLAQNTPPEKLLEAIRDVASGGGPMSSHIARKVMQSFRPEFRKAPLVDELTPREQQVLELLARGMAYKQIATELNLGMGTIQTHVSRIYKKLHVNSRTEAVVKFLEATPKARPSVAK